MATGEMARVVELERRQVEALARKILPALLETGSLIVSTAEFDSVERWPRAARRAGRILGWHVRTGLVAEGARVWAASNDFPVTDEDLREAARRVEEYLFGPGELSSGKLRLVPVDYAATAAAASAPASGMR